MAIVLILRADQAAARSPKATVAQEAQPTRVVIEPDLAPVQIDLSAIISGSQIVYTLYATNVTKQPVLDLNVDVPLPANTMLLSAQSSPPFVADYRNGTVTFYTPNLEPDTNSGPQRIRLVATVATDEFIDTQAQATWKYVNAVMRQSSTFHASAETAPVAMFSSTQQQNTSDMEGEVPLPHLDFTGVTVQQEGSIFRFDLRLAGPLGPVGEPSDYNVYIDAGCDAESGRVRDGFGTDYRIRYRHDRGRAGIYAWTTGADNTGEWVLTGSIAVNSPAGGQSITLWVPSVMMGRSAQFCWMAESEQRTEDDAPKLPHDFVPNGRVDAPFTLYGNWDTLQNSHVSLLTATTAAVAEGAGSEQPVAAPTLPGSGEPSGKLAIPLGNARGGYDVHVFSVPEGQLLLQIPDANQPAFRADGRMLLITRETETGTALYEVETDGGSETQVNAPSASANAYYDWRGGRIVFEDGQAIVDPASPWPLSASAIEPVVLRVCGLSEQVSLNNCDTASALRELTSIAAVGDVHGTHPVWAENEHIIYRGCPTWDGLEQCGVYAIDVATEAVGQPSFPTMLSHHAAAFPDDTEDGFLTLTTRQLDNWEVYGLSLDETRLVNLSRDTAATDGLSAISPDGTWVAFVSNREGTWSVWVASILDGSLQKILDLPGDTPWAEDELEWTRQRLSWGSE